MTQEGEWLPFQDMTLGPFAALLRVPEGGFILRDGLVATDFLGEDKDILGPWLVKTDSWYSRQYSPLAIPNLHRKFARTIPTEAPVLDFANEYGLLGHSLFLYDPGVKKQAMLIGESVGFWQREIEGMARLIELWELVKRGNQKELNKLVQWSPKAKSRLVVLYLVSVGGKLKPDLSQWLRQNPDDFRDHLRCKSENAERTTFAQATVLAHEKIENSVELLERWRHGDPLEPVRYFVHLEINKRVKEHVSPAVLPFRKGEIHFFPDCLLSALYTHLMLEISEQSRPSILCKRPNCGQYFEPTHGRQKYCNTRCQKLAHYYRTKKAKA